MPRSVQSIALKLQKISVSKQIVKISQNQTNTDQITAVRCSSLRKGEEASETQERLRFEVEQQEMPPG